ncbi:uncharacterized protein LOC123037173 [Drosophila rhopaloa]|uniref:RNA-directed DNA polymerase n=1 Tax=Drosophila rhopaloa TaxID=1041015 RepID=A0ABM5J1M2_DRORH|nr:uncharacterized protein LOC123037173 [Drosophila rhopaloa]
MRDDKPLKQKYYPRNPAMQHVIDTQVDELLRAGAHSAPIKLAYLGHVISGEGIQTDLEKVSVINGVKIPTNLKELRQWIGMASWYRRFVPGFVTIVQPVTALLKKGRKLGAVLSQDVEGQEKVIAYASGRITPAEHNYTTTEKECLAIIWAIRTMRCYLEGYRFEVVTDHLALKWLNSIESPSGRIARWALELQQFQFDVRYRRGKLNVVADTLSRQPCEVLQGAIELNDHCEWIRKMKDKVRDQPEKFSDYMLKNGQPWKLCAPTPCRARVIYECHDSPTAGHLGVRKTITRLSQRYFWPGMSAAPIETRELLLVFHDVFSKWVELIPLRKATAAAVQKAFRERILGRVGTPRKFVCDNGTQFTSRALKDYFAKLGVEVQYTAPYCPQENPTERTNRTVKTLVSQLSEGDQSTWDNMLPEISRAINSSVSDSTGYTPAFLTQGRELRLPAMLYDELTPGSAVAHTGPEDNASHLQGIFEIVRSNLQRASLEQARHYNLRRREWRPTLGSQVWLRQHPLSKVAEEFAAKLAPKYDGPYPVAKFTSPKLVRLQRPGDRRRRIANISQLKPYYAEDALDASDDDITGPSNPARLLFQMDDLIMLSDDSQDTEAFYPRANGGDSHGEEEEEEVLTSEGEGVGSSMRTDDDASQDPNDSAKR